MCCDTGGWGGEAGTKGRGSIGKVPGGGNLKLRVVSGEAAGAVREDQVDACRVKTEVPARPLDYPRGVRAWGRS